MKYVDEFRDPHKAESLLGAIGELTKKLALTQEAPLRLMEVCGGHTHAIFRYGIANMLPSGIEFVHGPGCPVCVLPIGCVDTCVAIAERPNVIFATFGDAMRVPGSAKSLLQARAGGADVRMVYSPLDALGFARENPEKQIVFFGLGFETTMPSTALTVLQAQAEGVTNFSLLCNHITILPTLRAILDTPELRIDGFLGPGHVSMVIGTGAYDFIAQDYKRPLVVTGFEPLDVLQSVWMLLKQKMEARCAIENQYDRVVPVEGNAAALSAIARVFETRDICEWRGLGMIAESGMRMREAYASFDAERKFDVCISKALDSAPCECGEVLKGLKKPWECTLFGKSCTPEAPLGALMVSSEGACAAYYQYGDPNRLRQQSTVAAA